MLLADGLKFLHGHADDAMAAELKRREDWCLPHYQAAPQMEGRTGQLLIRDCRCVLRVCTNPTPEEEPF